MATNYPEPEKNAYQLSGMGGQHRSPPMRLPPGEWAEKQRREARRLVDPGEPDDVAWLAKFEAELERIVESGETCNPF